MKVNLPKGAKTKITSSEDIYEIMHAILMRQNKIRRKSEYYWTIGLNTALDIMYIELVAIGGLNKVASDPVEVFSIAVGKKCKRLILVHNHPTGTLKPSVQDIRHTKKLEAGGEILGIEIIDSLIITDNNGYYSFADEGDL
jgi:DNA repair protein RadC